MERVEDLDIINRFDELLEKVSEEDFSMIITDFQKKVWYLQFL